MSRLNTQEIEKFKTKLERMRETLRADEASGQAAANPVMLDQASVGRLSRMDAIQGQNMAMEYIDPRRLDIVPTVTLRHVAERFGWRCELPVANVALMHKAPH